MEKIEVLETIAELIVGNREGLQLLELVHGYWESSSQQVVGQVQSPLIYSKREIGSERERVKERESGN